MSEPVEPPVATGPARVAILGPVRVAGADGRLIEPPGAMGKNLIVALALANGALSARGLIDDLWGETPLRNDRAALQTLVSRVRAVVADGLIASSASGYRLETPPNGCDLSAARTALVDAEAALATEPRRAARIATGGLNLWRGEAGADLGESDLAKRLAEIAAAVKTALTLVRARARLAADDADGAIADADTLAAERPFDEELQLLRMRALIAAGRRNDALRLFADLRERLRDELGTNPSAALVELNAALLREPEDAPAGAMVHVGLRSAPNRLVGRDDDVLAIERLMAHSRLTTILGAGGLGKTRLAQELAARAAAAKTPGVYVVELAGARSADDVPLLLAATLGIREYSGARLKLSDPRVRVDVRTRIVAALRERPTLLVVDNCEHLIDAVAEWVADILDGTTRVTVLATSRAPLMIAAESVYQLDSLESASRPGDGPGPAVTLFLERARSARPSAVLPPDIVARLCERLDGLPLAIELAAARVRTMSVEEVERRLGNRFALLRGGDRSAPERHRTLLAVIDWSWNLLSDGQRRTLRRLSRFVDGFDADAAESVAGGDGVADDLEGLVGQSLISVEENATTGTVRYRMLETVREFGDMALVDAGEDALVEDAMLEWAAEFTLEAGRHEHGRQQLHAFRRVQAEQENLVAALRHAIDAERPDVVACVFATLGYHWSLRGAHSDVIAFSDRVVNALSGYEPTPELVDATVATYTVITGTLFYGSPRGWARPLGRLRRLLRQHRVDDPVINALARVVVAVGDLDAVRALLESFQSSDQPLVAAFGSLLAAQLDENSGRIDRAVRLSHDAFDAANRAGDSWMTGMAAQALAQLYSQSARRVEALHWAGRAQPMLAPLLAVDDLRQLDWLTAVNAIGVGELDRARPVVERLANAEPGELGADASDLRAIGLAGRAELAVAEGRPADAVARYRDAAAVFDSTRARGAPWYVTIGAGAIIAAVRAGRGDEAHTAADLRALRLRILVSNRIRPWLADIPVLGSGILGAAVWLLDPRRSADEAAVSCGLALLGLSRALEGRQDFPTLEWRRAADEAAAAHGAGRVDSAVEDAMVLGQEDRRARAIALVTALRLHLPAGR